MSGESSGAQGWGSFIKGSAKLLSTVDPKVAGKAAELAGKSKLGLNDKQASGLASAFSKGLSKYQGMQGKGRQESK